DADNEMFDVNALNGEYVFVAGQNENVVKEVVDAAKVSTAATTVTLTTEEIALAQALEALKTSKPKVKEIVFQEPGEFDEEARLAKEKAEKEKESNIALIETWDDIDANIDVGHQLAERLQAKEQEDLSVEEKDTLFQQLLKKRRKHFAAKRVDRDIIELYFFITEYQLADMFTKALSQDRFDCLVRRLGMSCLTPAELEVLANETA
ncbi:hypothetical protein Tco_0716455, partial [Tanacetum coccineum]